MNILKSNITWIIILVALLTLLYVQSLQGHIKSQSVTIDANSKTIADLNKGVAKLEADLKLAKEITALVTKQKEELNTVTEVLEKEVVVAKKKVSNLTKEQQDLGDEINAAWEFYDTVVGKDVP